MKKIILVTAISVVLISTSVQSGEYDFDFKNKNDMRGAWLMCGTTGFTLGDCPKVFKKCWQRPMLKFKRHRRHWHTTTHCVKFPSFKWSGGDTDKALEAARIRAKIELRDD